MDLILRNARLTEPVSNSLVDIGVAEGRIAAIAPILAAEGEEIDIAGRLVVPGFVETHIHLDKSCILDRCQSRDGTLAEAIGEVAAAKRGFTAEDVYRRGRRLSLYRQRSDRPNRSDLRNRPVVRRRYRHAS